MLRLKAKVNYSKLLKCHYIVSLPVFADGNSRSTITESSVHRQSPTSRSDTESVTSTSGELAEDYVIPIDDEISSGADNNGKKYMKIQTYCNSFMAICFRHGSSSH